VRYGEELDAPVVRLVPSGTIPALTKVALAEATAVPADEPVVGVVRAGEARAYPLRHLARHECVNDVLGGAPALVVFAPFADLAVAYARDGTFASSGALFKNTPVLEDRETGSHWILYPNVAFAGPRAGARLPDLEARRSTWGAWRRAHPGSTLMAAPDPEAEDGTAFWNRYAAVARTAVPVTHEDDRLPPKTRVAGLLWKGETAAVPLAGLEDEDAEFTIPNLGPDDVVLARRGGILEARTARGRGIPVREAFWCVWADLFPETRLA